MQISVDDVEDVRELSEKLVTVILRELNTRQHCLNLASVNCAFFHVLLCLLGRKGLQESIEMVCAGLRESAEHEANRVIE